MIKRLKELVPAQHPLRLFVHKLKGFLAAVVYGFPSKNIHVIGVTGTKGKTTTVNLIASVLKEAGYKVGMASTTGFRVGDEVWVNETKMTTLDPFFLQKLLKIMVLEGCKFAVLEVSSHALVQNRVFGIDFDVAVLTNIGEDHLEYHGGFTAYLRAKSLLFRNLNLGKRKKGIEKLIVLNNDDEKFEYFDQFIADKKYTFGLKKGIFRAEGIEYFGAGARFNLIVPNGGVEVKVNLPGQFNVYNTLAAATVAIGLGVQLEIVKVALGKATRIPGRYEEIDVGQKFLIVVDYAHTTESLEKLLELYKSRTKGKLWVVFGATGGGRDKGKRIEMGKVADRFADKIVLTDDDPYEEDEWEILEDIRKGIQRADGEGVWMIPSRFYAIKLALWKAEAGDTVVIAGKGAEKVQMVEGEKIVWDDRDVVRSILNKGVSGIEL